MYVQARGHRKHPVCYLVQQHIALGTGFDIYRIGLFLFRRWWIMGIDAVWAGVYYNWFHQAKTLSG